MSLHRQDRVGRTASLGFSLIEVMIAVVILATGLLALAALQGALARSSADAKARGAIISALNSRMSQLRQAPPGDGTFDRTCADTAWICTTEQQASTGSLSVTETVATMLWKGGTFQAPVTGDDLSGPSFRRFTLAASWTDAAGEPRSLTLRSDASDLMYGAGYPNTNPNSSASVRPIIRQDNPSNIPGVIPLVTGNQATAASNPQPIVEGEDINLRVGTSFDVLNYVPEGATARIAKRFQTEVIKCRCQYGAAGYSVAGEAQWPTIWNGNLYATYEASGQPAGVVPNAGEDPDFSGVTITGNGRGKDGARLQSKQCTECCRDHHDASGSPLEARYDPEATSIGKYNLTSAGLEAVTDTTAGKYVAACRVVKADGIWKTTADMYERHYGLLETTTVDGVRAKSGIPDPVVVTRYQDYIKAYLSLYTGTSTTAPAGAQTMFDETARALNSAELEIAAAPEDDWRYLHGRGLYVDYLGSEARAALEDAISNCPTGTSSAECILPALPFTTINLTEMAAWRASDLAVLEINSTKSLTFDVDEPFGGRTKGRNGGRANNLSSTRLSNSGVAVSDDIPGAVDMNGDEGVFEDVQAFAVGDGNPNPGSGDTFYIRVTGANPSSPAYTIGSDTGACTWDAVVSAWACGSDSTLAAAGTIVLAGYNNPVPVPTNLNLITAGCTRVVGDNGTINNVGSVQITLPRLQDFEVVSVTGGGSASQIPSGTEASEITTIGLSAIPEGVLSGTQLQNPIVVAFEEQQSTDATIQSCTYKKSGSAAALVTLRWNEPWAQPFNVP